MAASVVLTDSKSFHEYFRRCQFWKCLKTYQENLQKKVQFLWSCKLYACDFPMKCFRRNVAKIFRMSGCFDTDTLRESVRIRSNFSSVFPVFGLNTEIYGVSGHVSRSDEFKEFHFLMNIQVTLIMMAVRKIHNRPSWASVAKNKQ